MKNFSTFFWSTFEQYKEDPAFRGADDLTYWVWTRNVQKLAMGLIEAGLESGERLAIVSNDRRLFFEFAFATWLAGGCVVPVPSGRSRSETLRRFARAGCDWIVVDDEAQRVELVGSDGKVPESLHWIVSGNDDVTDATTHTELLERGRFRSKRGGLNQLAERTFAIDPDAPAILLSDFGDDIHASSFSGKKLEKMFAHLDQTLAWREQVVALQLSPAWFYGTLLGLYALIHGNAIVEGRSSREVSELVAQTAPTIVIGGAAYLRSLTDHWIDAHQATEAPEVPKNLRDLVKVVGASALSGRIRKEFTSQFGASLERIYMVDAAADPDLSVVLGGIGVSALSIWGRPEFGISHVTSKDAEREGSLGRPVYGYACKTVGTKGAGRGPLAIKTESGFDKYWNGEGEVVNDEGWFVTPVEARLESGFLFLDA